MAIGMDSWFGPAAAVTPPASGPVSVGGRVADGVRLAMG